jgi:hypothetical protein
MWGSTLMQRGTALQTLHEALGAAKLRDLADVTCMETDWEAVAELRKTLGREAYATHETQHSRPQRLARYRPDEPGLHVDLFEQLWGSTALGYGGVGGAAMTSAYTVVVHTEDEACVYFGGGRLAYRLDLKNISSEQRVAFAQDLAKRLLTNRRDAVGRYGASLLPGD